MERERKQGIMALAFYKGSSLRHREDLGLMTTVEMCCILALMMSPAIVR